MRPLLFFIVLQELMDEVDVANHISLRLWYLDDGCFVGPGSTVVSLLESVSSKGPAYGLEVNMLKCEVFWPHGDPLFAEFPPTIEQVALTKAGAELLGSPVWGSEHFFRDCFSRRIQKNWDCQQICKTLNILR